MQYNGRVGHSQTIVLDVDLVSSGQLGVVDDLVLAPGHVSDAVLHLLSRGLHTHGVYRDVLTISFYPEKLELNTKSGIQICIRYFKV